MFIPIKQTIKNLIVETCRTQIKRLRCEHKETTTNRIPLGRDTYYKYKMCDSCGSVLESQNKTNY